MTTLSVTVQLLGKKLHRLEIYSDGTFIGEYERSQEEDIGRKKEEIELASSVLLQVFKDHGPFVVRWDGQHRQKSIRVDGTEVATIPKNCWQKASWE